MLSSSACVRPGTVDQPQTIGCIPACINRCRCASMQARPVRGSCALNHLALAGLGEQIHHHPGGLGAHGQIHGAAHGRDGAGLARAPVGQGRPCCSPETRRARRCPDDRRASWRSCRHGGKAAAGQQRDGLLAGVGQVVVLLARCRGRAHAQDAVLRNAAPPRARPAGGWPPGWAGLCPGSRRRRRKCPGPRAGRVRFCFVLIVAHACISCALLVLFPIPPALVATRGTLTTWLTKMPGVTTASGSSSPSSTISCTVATVNWAAMAHTGPKLRADMR